MKAPRRLTSACSPVVASVFEQLESRQLLAVTLASGVLTVAGSNHNDNISVNRAGGKIVVHLNRTSKSFTATQVDSILISGNGGNDRVTVTKAIANVTIDGGAGNDVLNGGGGSDLITGGAGDDTIKGRGGDDQMYGGALWLTTATRPADQFGTDTLNGGVGNDWLLSGIESDIINDKSGADSFTGGPGNDVIDARGRQTTGQLFETATADGDVITDANESPGDFVPVEDVTGTFSGNEADYTQHRHAFLKIKLIDDNHISHDIFIPGNAGEFLGQPVVHTHELPTPADVRGTLMHFHNTTTSGGTDRVLTLGDFFEHWGISLSSQNIGRFRVDANHKLTMTVRVKGSTTVTTPAVGSSFNNYVIQSDNHNVANDQQFDQIVITYGPKV